MRRRRQQPAAQQPATGARTSSAACQENHGEEERDAKRSGVTDEDMGEGEMVECGFDETRDTRPVRVHIPSSDGVDGDRERHGRVRADRRNRDERGRRLVNVMVDGISSPRRVRSPCAGMSAKGKFEGADRAESRGEPVDRCRQDRHVLERGTQGP